jgi:DNA-binding CsgD family transcriptional regulator
MAWAAASAEIVDHLDEPILPALLARALSTFIAYEFSVIFIYCGNANPIHIHDTFPNPAARAGLINYVKSTYVLNPFYTAYQRGLASGVYRMRDLAPDGFFDNDLFQKYKISGTSSEEIGYLTDGWPAGQEELCVALEMGNNECAEITLSRKSDLGGFVDKDIVNLSPIIPFLAAAFRRYWRQARFTYLASTPDTRTDDAFRTFGGNRLSPRERQLSQLLLRGHSTISVGLQLGISPTTVKTHRKNLYAKLGIGTQFELFALFLDSLKNKYRS